jgi:hypothetical protein
MTCLQENTQHKTRDQLEFSRKRVVIAKTCSAVLRNLYLCLCWCRANLNAAVPTSFELVSSTFNRRTRDAPRHRNHTHAPISVFGELTLQQLAQFSLKHAIGHKLSSVNAHVSNIGDHVSSKVFTKTIPRHNNNKQTKNTQNTEITLRFFDTCAMFKTMQSTQRERF